MVRICPFISINQSANQTCPAEDCALWNSAARNCAFAVIAEEMRSISAGIDLITDNLMDIGKENYQRY